VIPSWTSSTPIAPSGIATSEPRDHTGEQSPVHALTSFVRRRHGPPAILAAGRRPHANFADVQPMVDFPSGIHDAQPHG
jgi:hypothetical protein